MVQESWIVDDQSEQPIIFSALQHVIVRLLNLAEDISQLIFGRYFCEVDELRLLVALGVVDYYLVVRLLENIGMPLPVDVLIAREYECLLAEVLAQHCKLPSP